MTAPGHMAVVGRTPADVRDYMIEGPGGFMANTPRDERPMYEPSKRRLSWPRTGAVATIYSGEDPEAIRGFSGNTYWLDEFAKYTYPTELWDNLQFGMRELSRDQPRGLMTTTPRPIPILKKILGLPGVIKVTGSSYENRLNLDPVWIDRTLKPYEGTRTGRQEIHAEIIDDISGALFTRAAIERNRIRPGQVLPLMGRTVVGVDPSGATSNDEAENSNAIGIVAAGVDPLGVVAYVLEDSTLVAGPSEWAKVACDLYDKYGADRMVAEVNYGGGMVEGTIRAQNRDVSYWPVHASRGKWIRAEPVAALLEQNRIKFVGGFPGLEDELCAFTTTGYVGPGSPNRADALVWAITALLLSGRPDDGFASPQIIRGGS